MATYLIFVLLVCSLGVEAGSRAWEGFGHVPGTGKAASSLRRRWVTINPSATLGLWPRGTIKYCFESDATKAKLLYHLQAGRDLWYQNGLREADFRLTEVSEAACQNDRANVLLIKHNDRGQLSATPGLPQLDANNPDDEGPVMNLSDRDDIGMLNIAANFAHELGHVWGLLHEHQNPAFWGIPYGAGQQLFDFNCENLKDYAEKSAGLSAEDRVRLCQERAFAAEKKFSAAEYLPINNVRKPTRAVAKDSDIDLQSIMLYPSGAGGAGTATSADNDQRAPILLLASDGSRLPINTRPSLKDVEAIQLLYSIDWPTTRPSLISEPSNPKRSKFSKLFKRSKCL